MTGKDKKDIKLIVLEALDILVVPRLEKIDKKLKDHDKKFEEIGERFGDIDNTLTRIELKLDNEVTRNDEQGKKMENLNVRVLKLEPKKA